MSHDLRLRGLAARTNDGYSREVRVLAAYFKTAPDRLSLPQVGQYLQHLLNDCNFASGSLRVAYSGIKFFTQSRAHATETCCGNCEFPNRKRCWM